MVDTAPPHILALIHEIDAARTATAAELVAVTDYAGAAARQLRVRLRDLRLLLLELTQLPFVSTGRAT